jgi:hypothetical protein
MCKYAIKRFLTYLDTLRGTDAAVTSVAELTEATFSRYAAWLKAYGVVTYQTKLRRVKTLRPMVDWIRRNHPAGHPQLRIEPNLFPHAGLIRKTRKSYTKGEWDALLRAIAEDLAADKARLEHPYVARWKGEPPPLEEVASYRVGNSHHNEHSIWASREYQIWWWENTTNCQTLSSYRLQAIGGGSLVNHLKRERKERRAATGAPYRLSAVNEFYESIGAGPNYEPRYLGKPCPIKYRNRFRKPEYLHWYWENEMNMRALSEDDRSRAQNRFYHGIMAVHGGSAQFYRAIDFAPRVGIRQLLPYFLLLAVRTALNLTTLGRLTVDCIEPAPDLGMRSGDLSEPSHWQINWLKIRAFSEGQTIPTHVRHDSMPVSIIRRVIQITQRYRGDRKELWLIESGGTILEHIHPRIADFVRRHGLLAEQPSEDGKRTPLRFSLTKLRRTIAMKEYLRTQNLGYIQTLLGHRKLDSTVIYVSEMDNPILLQRRGLHQEAMFLDLTQGHAAAVALLRETGIEGKTAMQVIAAGSEHEAVLTHCKEPRSSPQPGQKAGELCTSNACLGCQNLVVTSEDLYRYFCFANFHDHLFETVQMSAAEYDQIVGETKYIFTEQIFPRFKPEAIELARQRALATPLPQWNIPEGMSQ